MGPWSHGDWARNSANATIGNINFGDSISGFYKNIEANFFATFLKITVRRNKLPEAYMFDTGAKEWKTYDAWPPKILKNKILSGNKLSRQGQRNFAFEEFVSDPKKPVQKISTRWNHASKIHDR
jgi:predicted acyl esterase